MFDPIRISQRHGVVTVEADVDLEALRTVTMEGIVRLKIDAKTARSVARELEDAARVADEAMA